MTKIGFDADEIVSVEFGVGYGHIGEKVWFVPVGEDVQESLIAMLQSTRATFEEDDDDWETFEPAEQYPPASKIRAPLDAEYMAPLRDLYASENLEVASGGIREGASLSFYFARFRDHEGQTVLGVRRASQFKGVLKAKNRLISWLDDTLRIVEAEVFRLDNQFDFLVDAENAWVLHASSLDGLLDIEESIGAKVREWSGDLQARLPFLDFEELGAFAETHRRGGRLIAALHSRTDLDKLSVKLLRKACKDNDIEVRVERGVVRTTPGSELALLQLLDRRRYQVELVDGAPELYVASGRRPAHK